MPEHPGATRIRDFLADLKARGTKALGDYFSPDVVWHVAEGNPEPGTARGVDALAGYYGRHRLTGAGGIEVQGVTVLASDHHGAVFIDAGVPIPGGEVKVLLPQLFRTGPDGSWIEYWILAPPERMRPLPDRAEELPASEMLQRYWYYSIELAPGVWTPGQRYVNFGLTRSLLSRCEVEGRRCLDIGTMEGAVPVLLSRRGAGLVVGVDVMPCDLQVALVQKFTGARFDYHGGLTHGDTVQFLYRHYGGSFDLVVLSGVLYHCLGPPHVLAMARSLVAPGGLLLVETNAAVDAEHAMFFNHKGSFSPDGSSLFLTSVPLLEYLLHYYKLEPVDCVAGPHTMDGGRKAVRVAVLCRAVDDLVDPDPWMEAATEQVDYRSLISWHLIDRGSGVPPSYGPAASPFVDPSGLCDVVRTVMEAPPADLSPELAEIGLDDRT